MPTASCTYYTTKDGHVYKQQISELGHNLERVQRGEVQCGKHVQDDGDHNAKLILYFIWLVSSNILRMSWYDSNGFHE
jgi:hypothetical protein